MMKKTRLTNALSFIVCAVLIAAMALFASGCGDNKNTGSSGSSVSEAQSVVSGTENKATVFGEGATVFTFTVVGKDGGEKRFEIHTDKKTVGEALVELGLIAGDVGDFGLYVKTVDGVTLDFEKDKLYWAFYANGEYQMKGVDATDIVAGTTYTFKADS